MGEARREGGGGVTGPRPTAGRSPAYLQARTDRDEAELREQKGGEKSEWS